MPYIISHTDQKNKILKHASLSLRVYFFFQPPQWIIYFHLAWQTGPPYPVGLIFYYLHIWSGISFFFFLHQMPFLMQPSPFILALDQHFTYALACASQVTVEQTRQCLAQRHFDAFRGGDRTANPVISRLRPALRVFKSAPPLTNTIQIIKVIHLIFRLQVSALNYSFEKKGRREQSTLPLKFAEVLWSWWTQDEGTVKTQLADILQTESPRGLSDITFTIHRKWLSLLAWE